jgi:hypothetical protein
MADEVENEQVIGVVRRNRLQNVRVSVGDYAGHTYVYCRIYPIDEPPEPVHHPGLTLRSDTARQLLPLLTQAADICEARESVLREEWDQMRDKGARRGGGRLRRREDYS